jgi:nucleoside-diphosphate-sugar epimerase
MRACQTDTADASDHVGAANAIAAGLAAGHTREKPGYWLHTGGTGILTYEDSDRQIYGERGGKIYDDLEGVDELVHLPDHAFHRNVDKIVLETGTRCADSVRTALVCPPTIYGQSWTPCERVGRIVDTYQGTGRGPVHQRSRQVYELSKITLQLRKGPIIGYGKSVWNNVHVHDLSDMFVLLVEAALAGKTDEGLWGGKAYYLAENGEHVWGDLSRLVVQTATKQGLLTAAKTEQMDFETGKKLAGFEAVSWGMNSRGKARRARKLLTWRPSRPSLEEEIPGIVKGEWERLQK